MKVAITTLGCKANQYDSSAIEEELTRAKIEVTEFPGPADAVIINTCTVTGRTDSQSRQLIRRARRLNPDALVMVTGCYAQVSSTEVASIEGVDYIVGNPEKGRIVETLLSGAGDRSTPAQAPPQAVEMVGDHRPGTPFTLRARSASGRTRANLKVQEGCNRACSYCIIPMARGESKSLPADEVLTEIDALVEAGFREVVLTGIHLGAYGSDAPGAPDLAGLLNMIEERQYPCRFRISSLDPDEVTDALIELLASATTICNHLHLPLQSGDDGIIRMMNRPYTGDVFAEKVRGAAARVPGLSVGADVIAGFPGEGDSEFEATYSLLEGLPVSYLHVFPFSARRGTPAAGYKDRVPSAVIKERCERLRALDARKRKAFYSGLVGGVASVLVESTPDKSTGLVRGRARNYVPVLIEGGAGCEGKLTEVRLTGFDDANMRGAPLKAAPIH